MTCVAFDGKLLVTDSQLTQGDTILPTKCQKIYTPEEGEYWDINGARILAFGFAGHFHAVHYVKEMLNKGITPRTQLTPETDVVFECICVTEKGDSYLFSSYVTRKDRQETTCFPVNPPLSVGSGSLFAYAMMENGKTNTAVKAVKTAINLDVNCGGELQIWELPTPPETPSVRPVVEPTPVTEATQSIGDMTLDALKSTIKDVLKDMVTVKPKEPTKKAV